MTPNELLLWLSARTQGSWVQFRTAVENLGLVDPDEAEQGVTFPLYQRVRYNLERLGHVEFDAAECENGWRVVPPALAISRRNDGVVGVLCGARSPKQLTGLRAKTNDVSVRFEPYPHCPDIVRATASTLSDLESLADQTGLTCQDDAPATLLSQIPSIGILQPWSRESLPATGKEWEVKQLVQIGKSAGWRTITLREANTAGAEGLFCFIRFQSPQYYLRNGDETMRLPGAVGKYWLLSRWRRRVLKYDRARMTLTLPAIFRPPLLTERALILCSGYPPTHNVSYNRSTLTYQNIPEEIAGMAAEVLRQDRI
jgi:hypothetical protein